MWKTCGGKDTIPHAFSLMTPAQVMDTCLACHARDLEKANIHRSEHTRNDVACTSCHSIHHSPTPKYLLAKKQDTLCYGCHATVQAQFAMPSKHRVNEGFMQCSDCHNPHGSFAPTWRMAQRPRMVERALNAESPCIKCHVDKRGPFVYEHPPVRVEGCEVCHYPHGSMNAKLLQAAGGIHGLPGVPQRRRIASARATTACRLNPTNTTCSTRSSRNAPPATWPYTAPTAIRFS